jgi:hypothetical protein
LILSQLSALLHKKSRIVPVATFSIPKMSRRTSAWLASTKNKTRSKDHPKAFKKQRMLPYARAKANAKATARTLHAVAHCVSRLAELPSDESAAFVAMPGPESVGNMMRPEEVETSCPPPDCWRKIVLTCKTSPAAIG